MNKEWSELNKEAKVLLNKKTTFKDGIDKLIALRSLLFNEWKKAMSDLSIEDYSNQPFFNRDGYESKTIAYSIFHVFRIEDIVLNTYYAIALKLSNVLIIVWTSRYLIYRLFLYKNINTANINDF